MLRNKLEAKINTLIAERLRDPYFLRKLLTRHQERLATAASSQPTAIDPDIVLQKLAALQDKKARIVDAFFDGMIDRARRDEALRDVERDISSYRALSAASSPESESKSGPLLAMDCLLRVIEPFTDRNSWAATTGVRYYGNCAGRFLFIDIT
jgi:hypothetical protein